MSASKPVRFGVYLPAYHLPGEPPPSARFLADYARRAEELGFESLWTVDHLFVSPPSYRVAFLDPLTALAVAAPVTEHVTLGPGILVLPLRDPVLTAKTLATLDALSGGRVVFGAGVGWDQQEFAACQVDRRTRGRRMDEMLEVIRGLWEQPSFSYAGEHFTLHDVGLQPRPVQPHLPLWLAAGSVPPGTSQHITDQPGYAPTRAMHRVARYGDALMSAYRSIPNGDTTWLTQDRAALDELLRQEGRRPEEVAHATQEHALIVPDGSVEQARRAVARFTYKPFEEIAPYYLLGTPEAFISQLRARIAAGIREIAINFIDPDPGQLELFARDVRPYVE
ncbi:MAG TPA: TIGR03619 family F420-dependent LLM class oxidoreductase [Mycobacteriales bacterium]|nr:TIGR03619 family F420-dependent LLM class oxidoreductase [Mycobacteriales bacterium]